MRRAGRDDNGGDGVCAACLLPPALWLLSQVNVLFASTGFLSRVTPPPGDDPQDFQTELKGCLYQDPLCCFLFKVSARRKLF